MRLPRHLANRPAKQRIIREKRRRRFRPHNQINVALRREIHLYDSFNLQLRGEAYNLLNHPDLGYIDSSLTDALFGQATLMLNQSFGPTGSLYEPGGPRSLQISLRLRF